MGLDSYLLTLAKFIKKATLAYISEGISISNVSEGISILALTDASICVATVTQ